MHAPNKQKVLACVQRGRGATFEHRVEGTKGAPKRHNVQTKRERRREQGDKT